MLELSLWISAALWGIFFLQMLLNRALIRPLPRARASPPGIRPSVSIVVPARNEERGVRAAVSSFCAQDYPDLEVVVVDDGSTDATPALLAELQAEYPRLRVVRGTEPPPGWLGKPNALETGRKAARGDWLIFSDADVVYAPDLVSRAVDFARRESAGMVVLWPDLLTGEILEAAVLSRVMFAFAFGPAFLAAWPRVKFVAVGAGVFNMVRRDALEACGAFECIKDAVIDDVGLGCKVKAAGAGQAVALAGDLLRIRMYHGFREALEGLNKNVYPALRKVPGAVLALPAAGFLMHLLPYAGLILAGTRGVLSVPALAGLALMHATLAGCVLTFRMPWYAAFLNPVSEVLWWWVIARGFLAYRRRGHVWRGRSY